LKFKTSAQYALGIISIVALIAVLQFFGISSSSSAFAQLPVKIFSTTRGVFDTETGEMLPQVIPLPIADALLDLDEQSSPGGGL
jgi:hypothetical protein